ncbi:phenazine biosynthesis PhzC/PhzF protein, partial [Tanacetum coccineum]
VGNVVIPARTRKSEPNTFKFERPNGDKYSSNGDTQDTFDIELNFPVVPVSYYNDIEASSISKILNGVSIVDVKKNGSYDIFVVLPSAKDINMLLGDMYHQPPGRKIEGLFWGCWIGCFAIKMGCLVADFAAKIRLIGKKIPEHIRLRKQYKDMRGFDRAYNEFKYLVNPISLKFKARNPG